MRNSPIAMASVNLLDNNLSFYYDHFERTFVQRWVMKVAIQRRKEGIIEAAIRVFAEKGFYVAGMRDIAEEAKVSIGAIYHYFRGKEEILIEIFRREIAARRRFFEELRRSGLPIPERIKKVLQMHFERIKENKELVKVMLLERLDPEESLKKDLQILHEGIANYVEEIIREGIRRGEIRPCNPTIIAYAILGMVEAVTIRGVLYEDEKAASILKEAPEELAESIWRWLEWRG